jgi:hypothetical protein
MVNVHEQWVHVKEKKSRRRWWRVSLTASAANWISDYVSVWLSGLNERRASKKASEWTRTFGWSSGLALYARTRLRLSHSTLAESIKKNKNAATNFFSFLIRHRFLFYYKCIYIYICGQGPLVGLERWRPLSRSSSSQPMYGFMFNTSMKEKKNRREEYREKRKETKKEKTVSCCYLMVNQQTTKTTQSYSL